MRAPTRRPEQATGRTQDARRARTADVAPQPAAGPSEAGPGPGALLRIEEQAREAGNLVELRHLIANEMRRIVRARQIFVIELRARAMPAVTAVSSLATVDGQSLLVEGIGRLAGNVLAEAGGAREVEFTLPAFAGGIDGVADAYPFREMAWLPMADRAGMAFAGVLLARETPWSRDEIAVARRLAATFAHAWRELAPRRRPWLPDSVRARWRLLLAAGCAAALAFPVPMTALAPAEIVARQPFIVAAPLDGVIEAVAVDPSGEVKPGDELVRFTDTTLRNRVELARKEAVVAEAKVKQSSLLAFSDARGRHELGVAQAELELKRAELTYAEEMVAKARIAAPLAGVAVYPDRKALVGKPVAAGERIMELADPARVEARVDLAVADVLALRPGGRVRLFLDIDPLAPLEARVVRADYRARPGEGDVLAFRAHAEIADDGRSRPRLGLRGTAQVYGETVPLGFYLFRRPISALRQWIGA